MREGRREGSYYLAFAEGRPSLKIQTVYFGGSVEGTSVITGPKCNKSPKCNNIWS